MRISKIILIILFLPLIVCCNKDNFKIIDKWENGNPKTIIEYINPSDTTDFNLIGFYESGDTNFNYSIRQNMRNGISKFYYENGQLKYKIGYKNDQFDNKSIFWYPNGQVWQTANYINGQLTDTVHDYYENGNLKSIGVFENGKGDFKYFHPNGEIWKTGEMINGKESGFWTYYFDNGVKSSEGGFNNGLRNGEYKRYYETGELMETGTYSSNVIINSTHYLKNGQIDKEITEYFKKHRNHIPWTDEQRQAIISECVNDKLKINQNRGDDYCYCMTQKLELFWSYNDYLKATDYEYQEIIKIIDKLCDYK
jgi:antitoxin component YwqK of YwqJK toxin-antitoxin module